MDGIDESKSELSKIIDRIIEITNLDEEDSMELNPGASSLEIERFESENSFILPVQVKEWLLFTDGCRLFDAIIQLYGVANKPFIDTNPKGISGGYFKIGAFNFGDAICIKDKSPKIVQYGETLKEYNDFGEFLEHVIEIGVED